MIGYRFRYLWIEVEAMTLQAIKIGVFCGTP